MGTYALIIWLRVYEWIRQISAIGGTLVPTTSLLAKLSCSYSVYCVRCTRLQQSKRTQCAALGQLVKYSNV